MALSSVTQRAMPPELGGKWATECLPSAYPALCGIQREADLTRQSAALSLAAGLHGLHVHQFYAVVNYCLKLMYM